MSTPFKIERPVTEVPGTSNRDKYAAVWQAIAVLADGEWLPVTVETAARAGSLAQQANRHHIETRRRGLIVYLRKKLQ